MNLFYEFLKHLIDFFFWISEKIIEFLEGMFEEDEGKEKQKETEILWRKVP